MNSTIDINWDKVRDIGDVSILPDNGFGRDHDTGEPVPGTEWLGHVPHGAKVTDKAGNRFTVLGYGSVQGSVILRNRYRQNFHADINILVKVA